MMVKEHNDLTFKMIALPQPQPGKLAFKMIALSHGLYQIKIFSSNIYIVFNSGVENILCSNFVFKLVNYCGDLVIRKITYLITVMLTNSIDFESFELL